MKRVSLIVLLIVASCAVSAQDDDIVACQKNIAAKSDSFMRAGQDPFEMMSQCPLNKPLPSFKMPAFNGDTIDLKKFRGKVVVINFWFIDCHPCIAEIPGMNKLVADYKNADVEFISITYEKIKRLKEEFFTKYKLDFKIIPEAGKYINKVTASGFPTTYILDKKGIIRETWNGGMTDDTAGDVYYEKAKPVIDKLLKGQWPTKL